MKVIKLYFSLAFISSFKLLYNHCNWFKKFVLKRALKLGEMHLILLELLMAKEPIDVDYWCDRISKINKHVTT